MKRIITLLLVISTTLSLNAQVDKAKIKELKQKALEEMKTLPEDSFKEYYQNVHKRVPRHIPLSPEQKANQKKVEKKSSSKALEVPSDMIYPAEFDEVQAIIMTWPYITRTVDGNQYAEQVFEGKGFSYYSSDYVLVDVYSTPDISNSRTTRLFRSLADGIQQNAEVWINIWDWDDSTTIKNHMESHETPLTNYRFFMNPGNSFWYRDCGPVAFYYGDDDEIGFMDFEYYGGRPLDDLLPIKMGEQAGYPVFTNTIEFEGGNLLIDGLGSLFTTDAVYSLNMDSYGKYYLDDSNPRGWSMETKQRLTRPQVVDSLTHLLNLQRCIVLPSLRYDGGTGHIDLYVDFFDEATFVSTKHPEEMAHFSDPVRVEENMDSLTSLFSYAPYGSTFYNTRIPLPAKNTGDYYTSQAEYHNNYTRSFANHTMVNNAIMQPVFYNNLNGDYEGNQAALEKMREVYPGYEFVEIDVRDFDGYGGAIHCITKQIPAENPVRIYHYPIRWLNTAEEKPNGAWITAFAQNKSGIEKVELHYRRKGDAEWTIEIMDVYDGNIHDWTIPLYPDFASDTLEYFISATSNNGKTMTKPFTAPQGYYTFIYGTEVEGNSDYVGIDCRADIDNLSISEFYPNPATDHTRIDISQGAEQDISVRVINSKGQNLASSTIKKGETSFEINTSNLRAGSYWVIFGSNTNTSIKKFVVVR